MAWLEITVDTASEKVGSVVTALTAGGFSDLVIEDQEEFETFLEENRAYWDYIDESLQKQLQGLSRVKLYLEDKENLWFRTTSTRDNNPTDEKVEKAIRTTQYGKCVYRCDNDVVDHQVVTMLLEDDITVTFSMNAFNRGGRYLHLMGTKGELHAALDNDTPIRIYDFETAKTTEIAVIAGDGVLNGHGGGDEGIVDSFYEYLLDNYKGSSISDIRTSVSNHLLVFAAEKARKEECVVDFGTFLKTLENR